MDITAQPLIETKPQYHLTKKNKLFCRYYTDLSDLEGYGNASQSALKAGYSQEWARSVGSKLINNPAIRAEIQRIENDIIQQTSFSRAGFVRILIVKAQTTRAESVQARYWEMIGRAKGFIEPDVTQNGQNIALFQTLGEKIAQRVDVVDINKVTENKPLEAIQPDKP